MSRRRFTLPRLGGVEAAAVAMTLVMASIGLGVGATPAQASQPVTWSSAQARVPYAQYPGHYGAGVTVAVLDTWIDATHPDFGGRVLPSVDCVGGSCDQKPVAADGCEPHGTHVAGIVASSTYGVAPAARILPIRVLSWNNNACTADSGDVARAVTYAADHGARIINISLGTAFQVVGQVTDVANAVEAASAQGVLVVAAAGNAQAPVGNSYGQDAVVVSATGPSGQLASYSQRGNGVDLAAPGGDPTGPNCDADHCVVSTWSAHQFAAFAGTSMAAPQVAGTAALLWAQNPNRSRSDVLNRMISTARPLAEAGAGLLDASGALGVTIVPATTSPQSPAGQAAQPQQPAAAPAVPRVAPAPRKPTITKKRALPSTKVTPAHPTSAGALPPVALSPERTATKSRTLPISAAVALLLLVGGGLISTHRRSAYSR